jgi:hypothetical protein
MYKVWQRSRDRTNRITRAGMLGYGERASAVHQVVNVSREEEIWCGCGPGMCVRVFVRAPVYVCVCVL